MSINEGNPTYVTIGRQYGASNYFDGVMSHIHWIDGTQYAASDFGETDTTTGEWKIKTSPSVTYGTNGFFILKDGNSVTDQSGQSNNLTVATGTLSQTEDCPSNNFPVFNSLLSSTGATFNNGSTYLFRTSAGNNRTITTTIAAKSGKFYAEFKMGAVQYAGVCPINNVDMYNTETSSNNHLGQSSGAYSLGVYPDNGSVTYNGSSQTSTGVTFAGSDIMQIALDLDNNKVFVGKNGTWTQSSNPANNTGGYAIKDDEFYCYAVTSSNADCVANFGGGNFIATPISSEGTNASGNGKFEYDVPANFTAMSTKGLNL